MLDCLKSFFTGYVDEENDNAVELRHNKIVVTYDAMHAHQAVYMCSTHALHMWMCVRIYACMPMCIVSSCVRACLICADLHALGSSIRGVMPVWETARMHIGAYNFYSGI